MKACRSIIEDNNVEFKQLKLDGEQYFKDHELRMLDKLGSANAIIEYSKINRLSGEIYKEYVKAVRGRHQPKQIATDKRVSAMIGKAT